MIPINIEAEENAIVHHIEALEAAENRKDIEGMVALVVEDFEFIFGKRKLKGKAELREMLRDAVEDYVSSKHVPLRVEVAGSGDMGWVLGYELNRRQRAEGIVETKQHYILTFKKIDGSWKEVAVCLT